MIIKVNHKLSPCAMIDKGALCDARLSYKARGILAYCLTQPAHLRISMQSIVDGSTDGRKAIRSAFRELSRYGYAKIESLRHKNGQIFGTQWNIYESPQPTEIPKTDT